MFRFTIRDVLWLTILVAVSLGWWLKATSREARLRAIEAALQQALELNEAEVQNEALIRAYNAHLEILATSGSLDEQRDSMTRSLKAGLEREMKRRETLWIERAARAQERQRAMEVARMAESARLAHKGH